MRSTVRTELVPVFETTDQGDIRLTGPADRRFVLAALVSEEELATLFGVLPGAMAEKTREALREGWLTHDPIELPLTEEQRREDERIGRRPSPRRYFPVTAALVWLGKTGLKGERLERAVTALEVRLTLAFRDTVRRNHANIVGAAERQRVALSAENHRLKEQLDTIKQLGDGANRQALLPPVTPQLFPESHIGVLGYAETGTMRYVWTEHGFWIRMPRRLYHRDVAYGYQTFPGTERRANHGEFVMNLRTEMPLVSIEGSGAGNTILLGFTLIPELKLKWTVADGQEADVMREQAELLAKWLVKQDDELTK